ncbi:hypothetical protein AALB39_04260 [Lachnospiraceae bacterium 54-53]
MKCVVTNGTVYLKRNKDNKYIVSYDKAEAMGFANLAKAGNILSCLPKEIRRYNMKPARLTDIDFPTVKKEFDISEELRKVQSFADYIKSRKEYLNNLIYQEEMKIVDIEHAAEFYALNASQGYKLYRMLRESRINRRSYKNELEEITVLERQGFNMTRTQQMLDDIKKLENKHYNPRVLEELFNS